MPRTEVFKTCPMCAHTWETQADFISDQQLKINGYLADFEHLELSQFYFTHMVEGCYSTMTLEAKEFLNLYEGERYPERRTGEKECPGYCLDEEQLARCAAFCECAFNREIIQLIKERQNGNSA